MTAEPAARKQERGRIAIAATVLVLCAAVVVVVWLSAAEPAAPAHAGLAECARTGTTSAMRTCYASRMLRQVRDAGDPTPVLTRISREVNRIGDYSSSNCHVLMHTVGRRYAKLRQITLASLMDYLPRNNDPGCAAGFAHCAQGAYHDYWLAVAGSDETTPPARSTTNVRVLCGRQPAAFVLGCWYRAFIERRPAGYQTKTAADLQHICDDTSGQQPEGCITAAADSAAQAAAGRSSQRRACAARVQTTARWSRSADPGRQGGPPGRSWRLAPMSIGRAGTDDGHSRHRRRRHGDEH